MKKILTTIALLGSFIIGANAQRSIDLSVVTNVSDGDTIIIDSVNSVSYIIATGFVNHGPAAIAEGDTIKWEAPYNTFYYVVQAGDLPFAMGDTLGYFVDTVSFSNGPATGALSWCDSVWAVSGGSDVITDPNPAAQCVDIVIVNRNGSVGIFGAGLTKEALDIFPNPASNNVKFRYNFTKTAAATIRVTDIAGRTVMVKELGKQTPGQHEFNLDITSLNNGMYYIELAADNKRAISKVAVQK